MFDQKVVSTFKRYIIASKIKARLIIQVALTVIKNHLIKTSKRLKGHDTFLLNLNDVGTAIKVKHFNKLKYI